MKKMFYTTLAICILVIFSVTGCTDMQGEEKNEEGVISGIGTVKYVDLEGGFYGIVGDDGKNYDPMNLTQEFQVDGLRVSFQAKTRDDVMTTRMWGTPVEVLEIGRLE